jgi:hypothetical protein
MAFRSDDQDYRWPRPGDRPQPQEGSARRDAADELSLRATLRELAVTIAGFVGAILLIIAMISTFNA